MNQPQMSLIRVAQAALIVLLLLTFGLFILQGARSIAFPYPLDYGEGPLLDQALHLADGNNIYDKDLGRAPHTISNYPPLFGAAYWYGRSISLLWVLLAAAACGTVIFRLTDRRLLALLPDQSDQKRRLWLVALLLTFAAFTRQSYVLAAPLAAISTLLGGSRYRQNLDGKLAMQDEQRSLFEFVRNTPGTLLADDAATDRAALRGEPSSRVHGGLFPARELVSRRR